MDGIIALDEALANSSRLDANRKSLLTRCVAHGTSLTRGNQDGTGILWPSELEKTGGITVLNKGVSGSTTTDQSLWAGAYDPTFTIPSGSIPSTTASVTVTAATVRAGHRTGAALTFYFTGTLDGIPGTLVHNVSADTWTFSRTTAGSTHTVSGAVAFHCTESDQVRDRMWFMGDFTNLIYTNDPLTGAALTTARIIEVFTRDINAMIARLTPATRRYIVFTSGLNDLGQYGSNTNYLKIVAVSAALTTQYGSYALDIRAWLIANGMQSQQLTPTSTDLTDIGRDTVPTSLRYNTGGDTLHLNAAGYRAWAAAVSQFLDQHSWTPRTAPRPASQRVSADPILTTGSLMLVDTASWDEGVPADGQRLPNLADAQARAVVGGLLSAGDTNPIMRRKGAGVRAARTIKGGLTFARPGTGGVFAATPAEAVMKWLIDHPTNTKYFSAWIGLSYSPSSAGVDGQFFRFGAVAAGGSNFYTAPSGTSLGLSGGGSGYMVIGTTGTLSNTDVGVRSIQVADTIRGSAADQTAAQAQLQSYLFGYVASAESGLTPATAVGAPGNGNAYLTFYRFYMEDLTVSGRSLAAVKAIDDALYAQAFASGGKFADDNTIGDKALAA